MPDDISSIVAEAVKRSGNDATRLLDIAREVQARLGFVGPQSVSAIAHALGMRPVEVRDCLSFYAFISLEPAGKTTVRLSTCVAGELRGADEVEGALEKESGTRFGHAGADADISLVHTSCIGMCDQSPAAMVDGDVLTNIAPKDVKNIVKSLRKAAGSSFHETRVESNIRQPGPVIFSPMERGAAIRAAVNVSPEEVIERIGKSRLRGRGGAGFPTAMKWSLCRKAPGEAHYLLCNCDEGEPGTFKDRVILAEAPDLLFEGMTVAGYALGAKQGILYLRGEYAYLRHSLEQVLERRRRLGLLGPSICGREGFDYEIRIQLGAGAYVCGEESSLIESLEGKRGAPRDRPPYPVQQGFLGQPTAVNNAETLCAAARIMERGSEWFASMGTRDSTGTKLLSVSGDCERPGVYELEFGIVIDKLLELVGARGVQAVQVGGPSGQCLAAKDLGKRICFEEVPTGGAVMVFDKSRDVLRIVRAFTAFFVEESCGWCDPCRIGTSLLLKKLDKIIAGKAVRTDIAELEKLGITVEKMSRCGLGQTAANPILTSLRSFPHLYDRLIQPGDFGPELDLDAALQPAIQFTGRKPPAKEVGQ
jgi:[NiFe] hydrogenase diaphorase moiety large subunit